MSGFRTGNQGLDRLLQRLKLLGAGGQAIHPILDLADLAFARDAVAGIDLVLHQAAIPSVPRSIADPITCHRANVDATLALLVAARDAGVRRVVYAASSSAYGDTPELPKRETMAPRPLSPYALQKLARELSAQYKVVYGRPESLIPPEKIEVSSGKAGVTMRGAPARGGNGA